MVNVRDNVLAILVHADRFARGLACRTGGAVRPKENGIGFSDGRSGSAD